ncbi:MAG: hypothetical protein JNM00_04960, partial [Flavobacteriales bacterium]|nr:hypothetical protein [Flavobacteriales bacterium]
MNLPTSIIGKNFRVFWWMVFAIPVWTCKHPPGPDSDQCGEATTIDEMMEWIYFKSGTYWVYEEETTGELDTLTVVAHGDGIHAGTNYRWFSYDAVSSRDGYNYYWWFSDSYTIPCPANENCLSHKMWCSKSKPGNAVGEITMFPFPLFDGNWIGNQEGGLSVMERYPWTLELINGQVVDAAKFSIENAITDNGTDVYYFVASELGIVKKE